MPPDVTVHTIGHSNHPFDQFHSLLAMHHLDTLVDVRSAPFSRYAPHFNRGELEQRLSDEGIRYVYLGRELGGRPDDPVCYDETGRVIYNRLEETAEFREGIDEVIQLTAGGRTVALMCSEEDPEKCHRFLSIAHVLTHRDVSVLHIRASGDIESQAELVGPDRETSRQVSLFEEEEPLRKSLQPVSPPRPRSSFSRS